jgi:acetyltransferase
VLLTPQRTRIPACARAVIDARRGSKKPVLACWMGQNLVPRHGRPDDAGVLQFTSPERCLDAFAYLAAYERHQDVLLQAPPPRNVQSPPDVQGAQLMIEDAIRQRHAPDRVQAKALLSAFHIPGAAQHQRQFCRRCAGCCGDPGPARYLHVNTPDRSSADGGSLPRRSVRDAPSVRTAYRELLEEMQRVHPQIDVSGVGIQRLREREGRQELQVGIRRDPDFGPVIFWVPCAAALAQGAAVALPPLNLFLCAI